MCKRDAPETGTIIGRRLQADGDHELSVAVTLPESVWDRATACINEMYGDNPNSPPLPLHARIALFLDMETQAWAATGRTSADLEGDLDDDVPF